MGSRSFAGWASYWPCSTDGFAPPMNEIPKVVFAQSLVRANLVDEYRLAVHPVALGRGKPLFAKLEARSSKLEACSRSSSARGSMAARSRSSIAGAKRSAVRKAGSSRSVVNSWPQVTRGSTRCYRLET
jgi:hypothetical protein